MIEVKNLSKQFKAPTEEKGLFGPKKKAFWAVKDLDFEIKKGSVASILGPNGCGKTTTLRMIAGMLTPSKGTAFIDSVDVRKDKQTVKSKIGYMTNNTSLYDRLNVIETVKFFAELNQISSDVYMPRAETLFDQLDMRKYLNIITAYSIMMILIILVGIFQSWNNFNSNGRYDVNVLCTAWRHSPA